VGRFGAVQIGVAIALGARVALADPAARSIDLAATPDTELLRVLGSVGDGGARGVPVAGGRDVDGDGFADVAFAEMVASPLGRPGAGLVRLVFGDGTLAGTLDAAAPNERILTILGDGPSEATGAEIWIDDVTGDGLGDLLIGRQNFRADEARPGAGALSIVVGAPALRTLAESGAPLDLRDPPLDVAVATLVGSAATARLGIWMRTGDVDGDGVADVAVGADQESDPSETHRGAVYLLRGGPALATSQTLDLIEFGSPTSPFAGRVARLRSPALAPHHHFGATCQVADLDGNGRAEVIGAAALSRAGAAIQPDGVITASHANGGTADGTVWIFWDESLPGALWPDALDLRAGDDGVLTTAIDGGAANVEFGEELVAGRDWDGDGEADLFAGDLIGYGVGHPFQSGLGHVLFGVASLRGLSIDLDAPPQGFAITDVFGGIANEIAADTAIDGDFDGDGRDDLVVTSPHAYPFGRVQAGAAHVLFGRDGAWPEEIDLAEGALPPPEALRVTQLLGADGATGYDQGDVLGYSAAAGDLDGDGRTDLIVNEMLGNGATPAAEDAGTLIAVPGVLLAPEPSAIGLGGAALAALLLRLRLGRRRRDR
jgi:hypothetical protein